jgi:hypothetical protein
MNEFILELDILRPYDASSHPTTSLLAAITLQI